MLAKELSSVKCMYAHLKIWNFININLLTANQHKITTSLFINKEVKKLELLLSCMK